MIKKILINIVILFMLNGCSYKFNNYYYKNSSVNNKTERFNYTTKYGENKKYSIIYKRN